MRKTTHLAKFIACTLALAMTFGAFTALSGVFGKVLAADVDSKTGEITYGSGSNTVVLNKDAWLNADGTYNIDLTAFVTGQPKVIEHQVPIPTDFILVIDRSGSMKDEDGCLINSLDSRLRNHPFHDNSGKLTAVKAAAKALVDELQKQSVSGLNHRVGLVAFGSLHGKPASNSTGLYDNNGNWHHFAHSDYFLTNTNGTSTWTYLNNNGDAANYYNRTLVDVSTLSGSNLVKRSIDKLTATGGTATHKGLAMAEGIIKATKNDQYTYIDANGAAASVPRQKIVIVFTDGVPGNWGFDMEWAAEAVNTATRIKGDLGTKIYTVSLMSLSAMDHQSSIDCEGQIIHYYYDKYQYNGRRMYANVVPFSSHAFEGGRYSSSARAHFKLDEEFIARDFNTIISSAYPCDQNYSDADFDQSHGRIVAKYDTIKRNLDMVNPCNNGAFANETIKWPTYNVNGVYTPNWYYKPNQYDYYYNGNHNGWSNDTACKQIGYYVQTGANSYKAVSGMYSYNMKYYNQRDKVVEYVNHPTEQILDETNGKFYIPVQNAFDLLGENPNVPSDNLANLVSVFTELATTYFTEYIDAAQTPITDAAFIRDIISENFELPADFDASANIKVYTQKAIGYENGRFTFGKLEQVSKPVVSVDGSAISVGFDFQSNACLRLNGNTVTGKKLVVRISGILAKSDKVGLLNTNDSNSGLYASPNSCRPSRIECEDLVFPMPEVNIRQKDIVYDFSLRIQDDSTEKFFEQTRPNGVKVHDVARVMTLDDPYAKQTKLSTSGYGYHDAYPYDSNKHAELMAHFEANTQDTNGKSDNISMTVKSINGDKFVFAAMLQLTDEFMRTDIVTGEKVTAYEWCRINMLPATNVHYEESLLTFTGAASGAHDVSDFQWQSVGSANGEAYDVSTGRMLANTKYSDANQDATHNTANSVYGHDTEYHNGYEAGKVRHTNEDSNGRAMSVKVDSALADLVIKKEASWPEVNFTFKGTGIDVIGRTGADTGLVIIDIVPKGEEWNYSAAGKSKHVIIDTYYGDGLLYQIPICHVENLEWGEYKVSIKTPYSAMYDHQVKGYVPTRGNTAADIPGLESNIAYDTATACDFGGAHGKTAGAMNTNPTRGKGQFNVFIDAIRVYNPYVDRIADGDISDHIYYSHDEHNPEYTQIRRRLIQAASFGGANDRVSGIVYIDGSTGEEVSIADYIKYGPKNEAYLKPGNGFAFTVKDFDKNDTKLHISAKTPNAKSVIMNVNGKKYSIDSATELFFDITKAIPANGRVVITCEDESSNPDAILSLCQIKLVSGIGGSAFGEDSIYVDQETLNGASGMIDGSVNATQPDFEQVMLNFEVLNRFVGMDNNIEWGNDRRYVMPGIGYQLMANGKPYGEVQRFSNTFAQKDMVWDDQAKWTDVPKFDENGNEIAYTLKVVSGDERWLLTDNELKSVSDNSFRFELRHRWAMARINVKVNWLASNGRATNATGGAVVLVKLMKRVLDGQDKQIGVLFLSPCNNYCGTFRSTEYTNNRSSDAFVPRVFLKDENGSVIYENGKPKLDENAYYIVEEWINTYWWNPQYPQSILSTGNYHWYNNGEFNVQINNRAVAH